MYVDFNLILILAVTYMYVDFNLILILAIT